MTTRKEALALRKAAEQRLKENALPAISVVEHTDLQSVVQELRVHQVELEMQNEELRRAHIEAADLLAQYSELYDFAPAAYFSIDTGGIIRSANLATGNLLGMERLHLMGCAFAQFLNPESRQIFAKLRERAATSHKPESAELAMVCQDSSAKRRFVQLELAWGGPNQTYRALAVDVSAIKKAELELREAQQHYEMAQEGAHVGIWDVDLVSGENYWSPECARLYGIAPGNLRTADDWRKCVHPDDLPKIDACWGKQIAQRLPFEVDFRVRHDSGETRWIISKGRAVYDDAGKPIRLMGINLDISDRKASERDLQLAKEAAEAANVSKSNFLATMSHEIRTPMNGILGMAQMLLSPHLDDSTRQDYARTVLNSGETLLTLLNDILDLSKVEAGKFVLESTVFDPAQILHETRALFAEVAAGKHLELIVETFERAGQRYLGDPHRLRQMISNLVGNAIKFTLKGRINLQVREIRREQSTALLEFSVIDTGIGIADKQRQLLFQPFSQADSSTTRQFGGSGLGLSVVKGLAKLMGGDVGVDSEVGLGSRFWFRIQAQCVESSLDTRMVARPRPTNPNANSLQLSGRVLVVEDNRTNRKVAQALLSKIGLSATFAEDGQQALDAIARHEPADLILMDVHMPVMDGYAATRRIREMDNTAGRSRRPIIALTADAFESDHQQCLAAGMDDFIPKPIALDTLREALGKWLPTAARVPAGAATPVPAARPVDRQTIVGIWRELHPLLERNQFGAIRCFKQLQDATAGTGIAPEVDEIGRQLVEFRFETVLVRLRQLATAHGWDQP